jgi:carbohydrate kinase (thermoresistant glucokinase family)
VQNAMVFIVMGVSGSGKTTIGRMLANNIAMPFHDADDFHSQDAIMKMRHGIALTDEDRVPWLFDLALHVAQWNRHGGAVLACSALKSQYREILSWNGKESVSFIYLKGPRDLILDRMKRRNDHYFPPELLDSQLDTLEEPLDAIIVRISDDAGAICAEIINEIVRRELLPQSIVRSLNIG